MDRSTRDGEQKRFVVPPSRQIVSCVGGLLAIIGLGPALASAADGVFEINQTCAVQTGCFVGDAAGYPVEIAASGSYRLTSNLVVPNENTTGILVVTSDVAIDLNQFTIVRAACVGVTTECVALSGTGSGVKATESGNRGISVRDGSIAGMGEHGVQLGQMGEVTRLRIRWSRLHGVLADIGSTITDNTIGLSGLSGILAETGSTITGNTLVRNGLYGINTPVGCTVSGNTAYGNTWGGIGAGEGSTVAGNTTYANDVDGINAGSGSTVTGNSAFANGRFGISAGSGSTVQTNTVRLNATFGLNLDAQASYRENTISSNSGGTVSGSGFVNQGSNTCDGTATCP